MNRELHCQQRAALPESVRVEETATNTVKRSEHRAVLPENARNEERAANTGKRSEQRLHCQRE